MSTNYDQASVKTQLSENGQNSASVLVGVLADPKSLFRNSRSRASVLMFLVCLFLGLTVAFVRRKGLSFEIEYFSWWAPSGEKHFWSLRCRFALGLSQGRKVYDSQGSWQH